jgi:hypothetical protein
MGDVGPRPRRDGKAVRFYALTSQGRAGYRTEAMTWMRHVTSVVRIFEHCA